MSSRIYNSVLSAISRATTFDELGRYIVEVCAKEFDAEVCSIWRRHLDDNDKPRLRLLAASAKAPQTLAQEITYEIREDDPEGQRADGVSGYVAQTQREVHVSSFQQLRKEYGFCWRGRLDNIQWDGNPDLNFHSLSAFPLVLGERIVGVFKLENKRGSPGGFPEADRAAFRELVPAIALAVHTFSLLESNEKRLIQVPARMLAALLSSYETRDLINLIVRTAAESLHAEICSLWLVDANGKELRFADGFGFKWEASAKQTYLLSDENVPDEDIDGMTAWVAVRKQPFWANSWEELKAHPSWKGKWDGPMWKQRDVKFRCLYAVPLIGRDTVIGVLKVENRIGEAFFTGSDRVLCEIMANLIVLVLELGQQLRTSLVSELVHLIRSPIGQVPMNLSGLESQIKQLKAQDPSQLEDIERYMNVIKRALLAATTTSKTLTASAQKVADLTRGYDAQPVSLIELVEQRLAEIRPLLYNGITIEAEFAAEIRDATIALDVTDCTRLQIAIDNILHNAIKYSYQGGLVKVIMEREDSDVILTIEDFGRGIPEKNLPRIFEAGFTTRVPDHPQGTGMGLIAVKQILDRLGWEYDVSSMVEQGTVFQITIPDARGIAQ